MVNHWHTGCRAQLKWWTVYAIESSLARTRQIRTCLEEWHIISLGWSRSRPSHKNSSALQHIACMHSTSAHTVQPSSCTGHQKQLCAPCAQSLTWTKQHAPLCLRALVAACAALKGDNGSLASAALYFLLKLHWMHSYVFSDWLVAQRLSGAVCASAASGLTLAHSIGSYMWLCAFRCCTGSKHT